MGMLKAFWAIFRRGLGSPFDDNACRAVTQACTTGLLGGPCLAFADIAHARPTLWVIFACLIVFGIVLGGLIYDAGIGPRLRRRGWSETSNWRAVILVGAFQLGAGLLIILLAVASMFLSKIFGV